MKARRMSSDASHDTAPMPTFDEILGWASALAGVSVQERTEDDCLLVQDDEDRPDCVLRVEDDYVLLQFFFETSFDAQQALELNSEVLAVGRLAVTDDGDYYVERRVLRPWLQAKVFEIELEAFLDEVLFVLAELSEPEE